MTNPVTAPVVAPVVTDAPSPNEAWKDDARLDANGNPVEGEVPAVVEPVVEPAEPVVPAEEAPAEETPAVLDETPAVIDPVFNTESAKQVQPLLEAAGLVPSEVAEIVTKGDGKVTIEIMQKLVEKHGEGVASLIKDKLEGLHQSHQAVSKAADTKVFNQVEAAFKGVTEQSGSDTFKELATWAKTNLPVADRQEINGLLSQGGKAAELAINSLIQSFKSSDSFIAQPAKLLSADGTSGEYGGKPLDKAGYSRELRKLMDSGHNYDTSPEIASLNSRRTKSLARGY